MALTGGVDEVRHAMTTLSWWKALREENGWNVDIAVETHDAFAIESNLLRLLDALSECKLIWDAHHTWRKGGSNPVRTWQRIRERVGHIHVKDSIGNRLAASRYVYVLPGDGDFPMAALLEALCGDGYEGVLSLEWERHWHQDLPTLEEALLTARHRAWW
ncbi:hypothetical protein AU476_13690 [Cupriavidus sp. UYMSc13B]|nr:hypothetical protein AU476_13690 [Cupriavidus sp. UYMSc13B]